MTPIIMKVGTGPSVCYWLRGQRKISDLREGQRISYREQAHGVRWERGIIREINIDMPVVERF